jgi:hypothetical protein
MAVRFAVLGDIHWTDRRFHTLRPSQDLERYDAARRSYYETLAQEVRAAQPEFVVQLGDLLEGHWDEPGVEHPHSMQERHRTGGPPVRPAKTAPRGGPSPSRWNTPLGAKTAPRRKGSPRRRRRCAEEGLPSGGPDPIRPHAFGAPAPPQVEGVTYPERGIAGGTSSAGVTPLLVGEGPGVGFLAAGIRQWYPQGAR